MPDADAIRLPSNLLPSDGRFGSGPSRIPPSHLEALAATGTTLMGTSHRRPTVRGLVASVQEGLAELFSAPEGYEIILGNGGATLFWDAAAYSMIEHKSQHLAFGEFSSKFASVVAATPHLDEPDVRRAEAGSAPAAEPNPAVDTYALTQNETSTGVTTQVTRPSEDGLVLVDATSAAGAIVFDPSQVDAYYFSPQKAFASDGGLFVAMLSPRAIERIERIAASGRAIPATLSLLTALENARLNQTYNTPAIATLFLMDLQIKALLELGGLKGANERSRQASDVLYAWATTHAHATPFVADPALRSPVTVTIDFDDTVDAKALAAVLRSNGIVDVEPYRKLGRNQLRIATFPATPVADVERLRDAIDWVIERLADDARARRPRRRPYADAEPSRRGSQDGRRASKASISASCCRLMPMSSRPWMNRCRTAGSRAKDASRPSSGTSKRPETTSTLATIVGSDALASRRRSTIAVSSTTGRSPFLVAF